MIYIVINNFVSCTVILSPLLQVKFSDKEKNLKLFLGAGKDLLQDIKWLTILLDGLKKL